MQFSLNPPSGLADSYFDVEFSASFDKTEEVHLRIYNETSNHQLEILGVTSGYIKNETEAIAHNVEKITGHIDIFNSDKMNKMFKAYNFIVIRADITIKRDGQDCIESFKTEFYNEAKSLDSTVIPIDLIVTNPQVYIDNNEPLHVSFITSMYKKIELCIRSDDSMSECCLQVSCKHGKTDISIPAEFLYYDLNLKENFRKKYKFYYIRYQGTTFSRLGNKQYLPIENSELKFNLPKDITPQPQTRISPTGKLYDLNFVLSDRYLVLCPKEYTGFAIQGTLHPKRALGWNMLLHESQHMKKLSQQVEEFSANDEVQEKMKETERMMHQQRLKHGGKKTFVNPEQARLLNSVANAYDQKNPPNNPTLSGSSLGAAETFATNPSAKQATTKTPGGCAPCSRKRQKNA